MDTLKDIEVQFTDGKLLCRGRLVLGGATEIGTLLSERAQEIVVFIHEDGRIVDGDGCENDLQPGMYLINGDGLFEMKRVTPE